MNSELQNYKYLYKRNKPVLITILGFVFALFALIRITYNPVFSLVLGIIALLLIFFESGIEFDFNKNTYHLINSFGPWCIGDWKPIPSLNYISVFNVNLVSSLTGKSGASVNSKQGVYQVNIITEKNLQLRVLETEDIDEAFQFAKDFAPNLDLKIWDATSKKGKWLQR
jgi:hypothetical protein